MPLPIGLLIVGAAALLAGGVGVAKGIEAKNRFDEADDINEDATEIYDKATESLKRCRRTTQAALDELGRQKVSLVRDSLLPFVKVFSRIKHVDYDGLQTFEKIRENLKTENQDGEFLLEIRQLSIRMEEVAVGTSGALGAGALAGLAAYGSVGLVGTASTGTAISGLSGVAATNATLAWFGGGSLAVGGLGIAGGTAVLGGIVAAPVLLVGGLVLSSKGAEARENARSNLAKAEAEAEKMKTAGAAALAIGLVANQTRETIQALREYLDYELPMLHDIVETNDDYRTYSRAEGELVARTLSVALVLKELIETPLWEKDGAISVAIKEAIENSRKFSEELEAK